MPKTLSMSCDQPIFVDQPSDPSVPPDAVVRKTGAASPQFVPLSVYRGQGYRAGVMLLFSRNKLSGSYLFLTSASFCRLSP